jgi:Tfp pilus assembly protein FimT
MPADNNSARGIRRGFVIGELLVALLLLAVAVSSLAALMYSVTRRPSADRTECVGKNASSAKCTAVKSAEGGPSKLLRSGCATTVGFATRNCKDTLVTGDSSNETVLRARTDSAALAMLAKKEKERPVSRPDRGFIR